MRQVRTWRAATDLVPDAALLLVALAAGLGAARLARTPAAAHVLWPIAACVVAGHLVVSLVRYLRLPDPGPSVVGVLAVALVAVWTLLPKATRVGLPTATTVRDLLHSFSAAGTVIRGHPTPVPATTGVVLCLAAGAGLAAVFARTLWSWQEIRPAGSRRPLVALFPTFGLFCYTALLSSDVDRVTGTILYLATALLFLAVADRPAVTRPGATGHHLFGKSGTSAALAMGALAVVLPLAASPGLTGLHLDAIPFAQGGTTSGPPGSGSGGGDVAGVGALNLIDDMRAVITSQSGLTMFTAVTPTPTYWQVATLGHFNGVAWLPDAATKDAAEDAPQLIPVVPPELPGPPATHTFTVHVSIGDLRSNLLPVPPGTISVGDAASVSVEPGIGVIQPFANPEELTYDAVARLPTPLGPLSPIGLLDGAPGVGPYLTLPATLPANVVELAQRIVAHTQGPAAAATALVRFFTQGNRFRYTLTPPPAGSANALSTFLFTTRAGFCQQFAGAFAVLARIDGLPTRLAVGFTTGSAVKRDTYVVTGSDAHSWPQVYLGPTAGWVSYEPTPASSNEALGAGVQNGAPTTKPSSRAPAVTTTTLSDRRLGQGIQPAAGSKGLGSNGAHSSTPTATSHPSWAPIVLLALAAVALIVAGAVAGPWLWRRRRPRLRRRRFVHTVSPTTEILARWEQAATVLARTGLGRRPSETMDEHGARLVAQAGRSTTGSTYVLPSGLAAAPDLRAVRAVETYRSLAVLAARASYASEPPTEEDLAEARRLSDELRQALRQGAPVGARLGSQP
jgi:hypothetical protein